MCRASASLEHLSKCGESVRCRFRLSYSSEVEVGSDSEVVGNSEHSTSSAEQSIQPIRTCTCTALLSMLPHALSVSTSLAFTLASKRNSYYWRYLAKHQHFVISFIAAGGFSGGSLCRQLFFFVDSAKKSLPRAELFSSVCQYQFCLPVDFTLLLQFLIPYFICKTCSFFHFNL